MRYWLRVYCESRLACNTVRGHRVNLEKRILPYIGKIPLKRPQPRDIQELYETLRKSGLSGTTVRYVHNNLHKALSFAVKQQLILKNPADMVEAPRVDHPEMVPLTAEQVKALLADCEGKEVYLPVVLVVTLGLRRGEVLALQWDDVDLHERTLTVRHSAICDKDGFRLSSPKTKNSRRTLLLPDLVAEVLEAPLTQQRELEAEYGAAYNLLKLVCCRRDGMPFSTSALQHQFRRVLEDGGLPQVRFHDLRHTNATLMLRSAVPAKIVSTMLEHSSIGITMDTYAHVLTEMQEPAVGAMNKILQETNG